MNFEVIKCDKKMVLKVFFFIRRGDDSYDFFLDAFGGVVVFGAGFASSSPPSSKKNILSGLNFGGL